MELCICVFTNVDMYGGMSCKWDLLKQQTQTLPNVPLKCLYPNHLEIYRCFFEIFRPSLSGSVAEYINIGSAIHFYTEFNQYISLKYKFSGYRPKINRRH